MKRMFLFLLVLPAVVFAGCSTYSPQPGLPSYIQKAAVPMFINKTTQYGMEQYLTQKTIDTFISNGRLQITDENKADAIVKAEITKYVLTPILFDVNQVPQQYRLRIHITLYFFDNKSQTLLWSDDLIREETTYYVANNLGMPAEDETTARNRVLDQLASTLVNRVINGAVK
jgi:hypothetical protein